MSVQPSNLVTTGLVPVGGKPVERARLQLDDVVALQGPARNRRRIVGHVRENDLDPDRAADLQLRVAREVVAPGAEHRCPIGVEALRLPGVHLLDPVIARDLIAGQWGTGGRHQL